MSMILALQQAGSSTPSNELAGGVKALSDFLLQYLTPLAAIGALSMSLIELWKKLFETRAKFHARRWYGWMNESLGNPNPGGQEIHPVVSPLKQLLQPCTGSSDNDAAAKAEELVRAEGKLRGYAVFWRPRSPAYAVFGLELERMMGSIQEAADTVLANPTKYPSLYNFFVRGADSDDVKTWIGDGTRQNPGGPAALAAAAGQTNNEQSREQIKKLSDISARLRQVVKGKLDGFQLYTSDTWANHNQLWANAVGIVLMFLTLEFNRLPKYGWSQFVDFATSSRVLLVLIGGILSPVAKDLVTALQNVKDG